MQVNGRVRSEVISELSTSGLTSFKNLVMICLDGGFLILLRGPDGV